VHSFLIAIIIKQIKIYGLLNKLKREEVSTDMDKDKMLEKCTDFGQQYRQDMEKEFMKGRREREKKANEESKLSEERMEKRFNKTMHKLDELNENINKRFDKIEKNIQNTNKDIHNITVTYIAAVIVLISVVVMLSILLKE
jgi:tetrahydromethanopterin S-methyltransferase subunit G